ncbi:hypothetical protein ACLOJK_037647 [Asimina triloba]
MEGGRRHRIILLPFMAQGHIIPFAALATHLQHRTSPSFTITIINTPLNIQALKSMLPPNTAIHLACLPFNPSHHGLPPNSENPTALPPHLAIRLYQSSQTLQPAFENLIANFSRKDGCPPLAIISDFFFGWTVEIANRLGIFHSVFVTAGTYGMAANFMLWLHLPHSKTDAEVFQIPGFPDSVRTHRSQLSISLKDADGSDDWSRFIQPQYSRILNSDGFLFNTVEELEKRNGLEFFRKRTGRPCWAIGPLKNQGLARKEAGIPLEIFISWLDLHSPNSVLYVSFGSQNSISASQMMELAMGLEASGKPFIWVVRPPLEFDNTDEEIRAEWLPEGFEERMRERKQGILVRRWAPQLEILSHRSTGAFLSHCGWNSALESLSRGVPLIGWPLAAEQFQNSELLEKEWGVCAEIARGNNSTGIERGDVQRVVNMVMGGNERGEEMRRKALQVKEMIEEAVREDEVYLGSSITALDEFLATIMSYHGKGE